MQVALFVVNYVFTTISMVHFILLFVTRLKRVEVQVTNDERENTFYIYQKLKLITRYDTLLLFLLNLFSIPIIIWLFVSGTGIQD